MIPKIIASIMKGFRINLLLAPTSCIVLIMNRLENIFRRIELLMRTTASTRNSTEKPKIHLKIRFKLLYTSTISVLLFFTSTTDGTDSICFIASLIFAGSIYSGYSVTSTDEGKIFSSKRASESTPKSHFASFAASSRLIYFTFFTGVKVLIFSNALRSVCSILRESFGL